MERGRLRGRADQPVYAVSINPDLAGKHEPIVPKERWIETNERLIRDIGAEEWLRRLLAVLEGGVPGRDASRSCHEPQVLKVFSGATTGELVIGSEHSAERVEHVLASLFASSTLTQGAPDLKYARDDPAVLVGLIECNGEID